MLRDMILARATIGRPPMDVHRHAAFSCRWSRLRRRLGELRELGRPLYLALSRKDLLGAALAGSWEGRRPADEREAATLSATALAVAAGAEMLRLHDATALDALRVAAAIAHPQPARSRG